MKYDVFISHASEDKDSIARPLAEGLRSRGLRIWLDEMDLKLGDSLRRGIDDGLAESRYGVVVLSPHFLRKEWTQKELDGFVALEDGSRKVILPVWHQVSREDILKFSPPLADKLAVPTSKGLAFVIDQIIRAVDPLPQSDHDSHEAELTGKGFPIEKLLVELLDRVVVASDGGIPEVTGVRTGFLDLDRIINGLQPGTLTLLAGRPLTGKTGFALEIARHVATVEGLPVLLHSPATSASQLIERIFSSMAKIPVSHLRAGRMSDGEWASFTEAAERLHKASMYICDEQTISISELQEEVRRQAKLWGGVGVVIVDSIQHLLGKKSDDPGEICKELRRLARELNCPVFATSALPRTVDMRPDRRPRLSDLNEIADVGSHPDTILLAYRERLHAPEHISPDVLEIIVARQRESSLTAAIRLSFATTGGLGSSTPSEG
ncbi:DnaB-like helicase C-terminal domain-containing protein [Variovorax atrisoli]|uniref:DnaB-like helicase C-terminal domain-containing protein n=1 Tax=Variovorax atrisoli TaxID=3394203 RepID=UPI00339110C1